MPRAGYIICSTCMKLHHPQFKDGQQHSNTSVTTNSNATVVWTITILVVAVALCPSSGCASCHQAKGSCLRQCMALANVEDVQLEPNHIDCHLQSPPPAMEDKDLYILVCDPNPSAVHQNPRFSMFVLFQRSREPIPLKICMLDIAVTHHFSKFNAGPSVSH